MLRRIPVLAATLACCALMASTAAASSSITGSVQAGGSASMTIDLVAPARTCQLVAFAPDGTPVTLSQVKPTGMKVRWVWQVPSQARTAIWRLVASCGVSRIGAVLTVQGRSNGGALSLARGVSVLQDDGSSSGSPQVQVARAAQTWWSSDSSSILSGFHSGPSAGQCTDYVAARRPDVIERVDIWAYSTYLLGHSGSLNLDWAAKNWTANAQRAGLPIGTVARPGAVVVFQPGAYGATSLGHVAYVSAVGRDGSFTVSEMHAPAVGRVTSRHFNAGTARAMSTDPRITFIYR